ncbi:MAG TPA: hypothetical protein VI078_03925 [bacterium]
MDIGGGRITAADDANEQPAVFAGRIVHEAWHGELARSGQVAEGAVAEGFCLARQNEFLRRAGLPAMDLRGALESRYWEKEYWSRDW